MPVYVTAPGVLQEAIAANASVRKGDVLGRLSDPDLDRQILEATNRRNAQALRLQDLQARRAGGRAVAAQIPTAQESLADLEERVRQLHAYRDLLLLKAPATGTVHVPPRVPKEHALPDRLGDWSGSPLEEANRGCWLEAGTLLCLVAERDRFEAIAVVDQEEMELVRAGQFVRILLHQRPTQVLRGVVRETARTRLDVGPRQLVAAGDLPGKPDTRGVLRPANTAYQARIALDSRPPGLLVGAPGRCAIRVAPQSLAQRLLRYARRTLRLGSRLHPVTGKGTEARGIPKAPEPPDGSRGRSRPSGWAAASAGSRAMPPHSHRSGPAKSPAAECPRCSRTARG
jgi:putative peptide zinc metalloprotease protein